MKKFFALLFLVSIVAGSCTKEYQNPNGGNGTNNNNNTGGTGGGTGGGGGGGGFPEIGPVPTSFSQKILIEEFTGEWCGYCPDGAIKVEAAEDEFPGIIYGATIHDDES